MKKVKVAMVGAGGMADAAHAPSLAAMPDVEIGAICDVVEERAKAAAAKFGIPGVYTDFRRMIDETEPEAVYAVVRPQHLWDIAHYALTNGRHLFVEKPPGINTEQTRQLAHLAARHKCLTAVGFQRRYTPITVECRRRVLEQGPMYQVVVSFLKWYEGGPIYEGATDLLYADVIHIVDTIRWAAGAEAAMVHSDVRAHGTEYSSAHNAFIRFENGTVGYLQSNHRVGARQLRMEMHGHRISCVFAPEEGGLVYEPGKEPEKLVAAELAGGPEMFRIGFYQEGRHFIDCVKSGRQPDTNLMDALKTMKLCDAILRNSPPWTHD